MTIKELKKILESCVLPIVVIGFDVDKESIHYNSFNEFYVDKSIDEFHLIAEDPLSIRKYAVYIWVEEL